MKKILLTLAVMLTTVMSASAMSYEQAREQALFLTDKMAYELDLNESQYEAAYEVNLDYLMSVTTANDVYSDYWTRRNLDLSYILFDWQYRTFCGLDYFYRPLYWGDGYWHFRIFAHYPHHDFFYYGRPAFYISYRGGHAWHMNGGRSYYHGRHFGSHHDIGMRGGWDRGGYRNMNHGWRVNDGGNRGFHAGSANHSGGNRGGMHFGGNRADNHGGSGHADRGGNRGSYGSADRGGSRGSYGSADRGVNRGSSDRGVNRGSSTRETVGGRPAGGHSSGNYTPSRSFGGSRSSYSSSYGGSRGGSYSSSSSSRSGSSFSGGASRGGGFSGGHSGGGFSGGHSGGGHSGGGSHGGGHSGGGHFGGGHR